MPARFVLPEDSAPDAGAELPELTGLPMKAELAAWTALVAPGDAGGEGETVLASVSVETLTAKAEDIAEEAGLPLPTRTVADLPEVPDDIAVPQGPLTPGTARAEAEIEGETPLIVYRDQPPVPADRGAVSAPETVMTFTAVKGEVARGDVPPGTPFAARTVADAPSARMPETPVLTRGAVEQTPQQQTGPTAPLPQTTGTTSAVEAPLRAERVLASAAETTPAQTPPQVGAAPVQREVPIPPAAAPLPAAAVAAMSADGQKRAAQAPVDAAAADEPVAPREARGEAGRALGDITPVQRPQTAEPTQLPQPATSQSALLAPETPVKPAADSALSGDLAKFADIAPASDVRGTQSTVTTQPPSVMAPEPLRPPTLQIVEALRLAPGTVDLVLVPEELGRLTLNMVMDDGTMSVTVTAERAETLDLVRRNAGLLEAEARAAGFDSVSFTFAENGSGSGSNTEDADGAGTGGGDLLQGPDGEVVEPDVTAVPVSGSLDLRL
ncbi:MAG: flagellar hook-length control protein FliK [Pseudomonadota bacterium]